VVIGWEVSVEGSAFRLGSAFRKADVTLSADKAYLYLTTHLVVDPGSPKIYDAERDSRGTTHPACGLSKGLRSGLPTQALQSPGCHCTLGGSYFHRSRHSWCACPDLGSSDYTELFYL
jgi:hypothetical protein